MIVLAFSVRIVYREARLVNSLSFNSTEDHNDQTKISPGAPSGKFHVEFRTPGTTTDIFTADVTLTPVAGSPFGTFTVPHVPPGTYDVRIKGGKNLAVLIPNVTLSGNVTLPDKTLLAGDANNDNMIDIADFGILVNAYGGVYNQNNGYDPAADFNFDGRNDIGDFGLLVNEFGSVGSP